MDVITEVKLVAAVIRDISIIIGMPFIAVVAFKIYGQYIKLLKEKNDFLKETQFDRALSLIKSQRELYEIEKGGLTNDITELTLTIEKHKVRITELEGVDNHKSVDNNKALYEQALKDRLKKLEEEDYRLAREQKLVNQLSGIYNTVFADTEFVADFRRYFFKNDHLVFSRYGGHLSEASVTYARKMEKLGIATSEFERDEMEDWVFIKLNETGLRLKELLLGSFEDSSILSRVDPKV